jgi:hypothetical protein
MQPENSTIVQWLRVIEAEYKELPGLSLSKRQMQRLWGLEALDCDALLDALVAAGTLRRTVEGTYVAH